MKEIKEEKREKIKPILRSRRPTMAGFKIINRCQTAGAEAKHVIMDYPEDNMTQLYLPDNTRYAGETFMYCVEMIEALGDEDSIELMGLYISAICSVFYQVVDNCKAALKEMGIGTTTIKLPSQAAQHQLQLPERSHFSAVLVMLGQLLLIPFKNINQVSYTPFMNKRANALKAYTGCYYDVNITAYVSMHKASIIKAGVGSLLSFKRNLLNAINNVSGGSSVISNMCNYLMGILAWTDMSSFVFIHDTLLATGSPVLHIPWLTIEVANISRALREIVKLDQPQFFRILGDPHLHYLVNRNNFPVLAAVASGIRSDATTAASQFVSTFNKETKAVAELIQLHKSANLEVHGAKFIQNLQFLTDFTEEETCE